jgi:hypothetical protein
VREFASALDDVGALKKGKPYTYLVEGKSIDNAIDV